MESGSKATSHDEGDLYFVNPDGEFIASYGPSAEPKAIGKEFSDLMKVQDLFIPISVLLSKSERGTLKSQIHLFSPEQVFRICLPDIQSGQCLYS